MINIIEKLKEVLSVEEKEKACNSNPITNRDLIFVALKAKFSVSLKKNSRV